MEAVVGGHCDEAAPAGAEREEYHHRSLQPDLRAQWATCVQPFGNRYTLSLYLSVLDMSTFRVSCIFYRQVSVRRKNTEFQAKPIKTKITK